MRLQLHAQLIKRLGKPPVLRFRIIRWGLIVVLLIGIYIGSFFVLRKMFHVSTGYPDRIYYFSKSPLVNEFLWQLYQPLHRSADQPETDNEWHAENVNSEPIYLRDLEPWSEYW